MKKLLMFMAAMFMIVACKDDNGGSDTGDGDVVGLPDINTYVGTVKVTQEDGTVFTRENVRSEFVLDEASGKMTLKLYEVSFAASMPVTIDMVVEGVAFSPDGDEVDFSGEGIVPALASGTPFPMYTITGLDGTLTRSAAEFSARFGAFPVTYSAVKK